MHGAFLQDLAIVMLAAGLVTVLFRQLRQPVVLGYILAGVLIGPRVLAWPLITDQQSIQTLSDLGIVLLMFSLGIQFSLRRLLQTGVSALVAGGLQILLVVGMGYSLGRLFGWRQVDSLFLGAMLLSSSTIIIVKTLSDLGMIRQKFAEVVFGILVIEDLIGIAVLALLSSVAVAPLSMGGIMATAGKMAVFLAAVVVLGLLVVPAVLRYVARFGSDETLLISVLAMVFGMALLAMQLRYSLALGAFLIGAVIAETRQHGHIHNLIGPVRDMFSAIFFVSVGLLFDPGLMRQYWLAELIVVFVVVLGKGISGFIGTFIAGYDRRTAARAGMSLTQTGEFAFIITQLGISLGVISPFLYPIAVTVSAVTAFTAPYLIRSSDAAIRAIERLAPAGLTAYLETYTRWVATIRHGRTPPTQLQKLMRKWAVQIALNVLLMTGLFIAAASLLHWWEPNVPHWTGGPRTVVWTVAVLAALPLLIATARKLRAVAMVVAEVAVARGAAREHTPLIRGVIANTILGLGLVGLALWVLLLSVTILPPWPVLISMLLVIAIVTVVMWNSFVKLYARAQISLRETLKPPENESGHGDTEQR